MSPAFSFRLRNYMCKWTTLAAWIRISRLPRRQPITMLPSDNENIWQCSISIVTTLWSGWPCSVWSIYPVLICLRLNPQYGLSVPCLFQADRAGYFYEGAVSSNTLLVLVRIWPHARLAPRSSSMSRMKIASDDRVVLIHLACSFLLTCHDEYEVAVLMCTNMLLAWPWPFMFVCVCVCVCLCV